MAECLIALCLLGVVVMVFTISLCKIAKQSDEIYAKLHRERDNKP